MFTRPKPVVLVIVDGLGIASPSPANPCTPQTMPYYHSLLTSHPHTQLLSFGESVGLPPREPGNTETGHINIGAGRIVYQDLPKINLSIADGTFFTNPSLVGACVHAKKNHSSLHLLGLVGGGGVHSDISHLFDLLRLCREQYVPRVYIHVITDGRDSPPTSSQTYLVQLQHFITQNQVGQIGSIQGRYYAMDRDLRWDRTAKAYFCLTQGVGKSADNVSHAVSQAYSLGQTDEFIEPTLLSPEAVIKDNDAVIFFNFRIDRPRQLTKAFVLPDFESSANLSDFDPYTIKYHKKHTSLPTAQAPFIRGAPLTNLYFSTLTEYQKNLPVSVAFPPSPVPNSLAHVIAQAGLTQLHASESEKERFVTYYFNGLVENPVSGEDRLIIQSPKVATYDLAPQMAAGELTAKIIEAIRANTYDFIVVNYANPDMVGHTGNLQAAQVACQTLDQCLRDLHAAIREAGVLVISSDHGNVENMLNTEHDANPVPFVLVGKDYLRSVQLRSGILADIAPTILNIMGLPIPPEMTGHSLLPSPVV